MLTQNQSQLSRWKQNLQAAVEERQQVVSVRTAELIEQLLLSAAEGRLLGPVKHQNLTGHLEMTPINTDDKQYRRAGST